MIRSRMKETSQSQFESCQAGSYRTEQGVIGGVDLRVAPLEVSQYAHEVHPAIGGLNLFNGASIPGQQDPGYSQFRVHRGDMLQGFRLQIDDGWILSGVGNFNYEWIPLRGFNMEILVSFTAERR